MEIRNNIKGYIVSFLAGALVFGVGPYFFKLHKKEMDKSQVQTETKIENCEYSTKKPLIRAYKPIRYSDLVALVKNMKNNKLIEIHSPHSLKQIPGGYWSPLGSDLTKLTEKLSSELRFHKVELIPDRTISLNPVLYIHKTPKQ